MRLKLLRILFFDESDPQTLALHRWANWLHVDTQASVVASRLPFKEGDEVDAHDIQEAERIIRSESYLRDAKVDIFLTCEIESKAKVKVKTWDNWSLLPTLSFSRKGGENRFALGFNEDNLLGMGIRTRVLYQSDAQRTGYRFTFRAPVPYDEHATAYIDLEDNDDGQRVQLIYDKPFYTYDAPNSAYLNLLSDKRTEEVFQNGGTRNLYDFQGRYATASYGMLWSQDALDITRLRFGVSYQQAQFLLPQMPQLGDSLFLPSDREYLYPWVEAQWKHSDYRILTDVYLINQKEDINLGWQHSVQFGVESKNNDQLSGVGYHMQASTQAGL